ncbi:MAG TPA: hypothetical protein VNS11_06995 [Sphingomicrobium sp.]|nr:hypothetical protein [Sphingomicrobium sp.]HWJ58714.1 hypothetical protein [Sphingomicrobium sp.]
MRFTYAAGTAFRLLCLPFAALVLISCGRQPHQINAYQKEAQELHGDIDAVKNSPSLDPASNQAGPPIHVDPYPHSAGASHHAATLHTRPHH